jgi:hypothetical protein
MYMSRHGTTLPYHYYQPTNETLFALLHNKNVQENVKKAGYDAGSSSYYTGHVGKLGIWVPNWQEERK